MTERIPWTDEQIADQQARGDEATRRVAHDERIGNHGPVSDSYPCDGCGGVHITYEMDWSPLMTVPNDRRRGDRAGGRTHPDCLYLIEAAMDRSPRPGLAPRED